MSSRTSPRLPRLSPKPCGRCGATQNTRLLLTTLFIDFHPCPFIVMAGRGPAISLNSEQCQQKRDARDKQGHDGGESHPRAKVSPASFEISATVSSAQTAA